MCYSAIAIANYFIQKALDRGEGITNLRLQKVIYFAHATYYSSKHKRLFDDPVAAWPLGPVVPNVYYAVKAQGGSLVTDLIPIFVPKEGICVPLVREDDKETLAHLDAISRIFNGVETGKIVALSHQPGGAWYKTLEDKGINPKDPNLANLIPRNLTILDDDIETLGK